MIICLDLGATEIKSALVKNDPSLGALISGEVKRLPTNASMGKEGILDALYKSISMHLGEGVVGIAIASAGDVDPERGIITYATDNLPAMTGFDFRGYCEEKFSLPCHAINDAHAALLGEIAFGVGGDYKKDRVAMITLGSGVGGGYYANGMIVSNPDNDYGRFGHIRIFDNGRKCTCGKQGCAEMYLSGRALHKDAALAGVDGPDLFEKYAKNVNQNVQFIDVFRQNLKILFNKIEAISPFDVCIIGGGVTDWMGEDFDAVTSKLGHKVLRAELGNHAGIYGAFYNYINR